MVVVEEEVDIFVVEGRRSDVFLVVVVGDHFLFSYLVYDDIGLEIFGHEVHDHSLRFLAVSGYLLLFGALQEVLELLFF